MDESIYQEKSCTKCLKFKSLEDFCWRKTRRKRLDGSVYVHEFRSSQCRECLNEKERERIKNNPDRRKANFEATDKWRKKNKDRVNQKENERRKKRLAEESKEDYEKRMEKKRERDFIKWRKKMSETINTRWLVARKQQNLLDRFEIETDSEGKIVKSPAQWMDGLTLPEFVELSRNLDRAEVDLTRKCTNEGICVMDVMGNWCVFCKRPFSKHEKV